MPSEDTEILEFNRYQKSEKAPFIIYVYFECLIKNIDRFENNLENSSTAKVGEHIPSGISMSIISSFKIIENNHDVYRGKDCMIKFCEFLREYVIEIIHFKIKKCSYYQNSSSKHVKMQKSVLSVKRNIKMNMWKINNIVKLEIIVIIQKDIEMLRIANEI